MSLGRIARRVLGRRFHTVGRAYVAIFGNERIIAQAVSEQIPYGATVLDVGCGDGAPANRLLKSRPDLSIVILDIARDIGGAIEEQLLERVTLVPGVRLRDYSGPRPDAIVIMDVVHHVRPSDRHEFFSELAELCHRYSVPTIVVKDVEPGLHPRAWLGYLADRYVSGDRNVSPIGRSALSRHLEGMGAFSISEGDLRARHAPHYCLVAKPVWSAEAH